MESTPQSEGVLLDHGSLGQICYHLRWSAALSARGDTDQAVPHAILAGALLDVIGGEQLRTASSTLDLPEAIADPSSPRIATHRATTVELGLQLVSHFTSDGQHRLADLYQEATRRVSAAD